MAQWSNDDLRAAFVAGAKWWEFHMLEPTTWLETQESEYVELAESVAESRYPGGKPTPPGAKDGQ